jgi:hypothetical protein
MKDKSKERLYFLTINFVKDRHKDLIEWLKSAAERNEQSLSAFCITALKRLKEQEEATNAEED